VQKKKGTKQIEKRKQKKKRRFRRNGFPKPTKNTHRTGQQGEKEVSKGEIGTEKNSKSQWGQTRKSNSSVTVSTERHSIKGIVFTKGREKKSTGRKETKQRGLLGEEKDPEKKKTTNKEEE